MGEIDPNSALVATGAGLPSFDDVRVPVRDTIGEIGRGSQH